MLDLVSMHQLAFFQEQQAVERFAQAERAEEVWSAAFHLRQAQRRLQALQTALLER